MAKPTQSLAAQKGALTAELKLPDVFTAPVTPMKAKRWAPYIVCVHPKRADEWAKLPTTAKEGDLYLVADGSVTALPVARVSPVRIQQYWAKLSSNGDLIQASFEEQPYPFKEHAECVLMLYHDGRAFPVNAQFRGPKCAGVLELHRALELASTPEWASKSAAHQESLIMVQPFLRFYGEFVVGDARPSKSNGNLYRPTSCKVHPTTANEWRALKALQEDPDAQRMMDEAGARFSSRIADLQKKLV